MSKFKQFINESNEKTLMVKCKAHDCIHNSGDTSLCYLSKIIISDDSKCANYKAYQEKK